MYGYRRRRRSHGRQKPQSSRKRTPDSSSQSLEFVRRCFFSFDDSSFSQLADFYSNKYGKGAKQYLLRTYPLWKSGTTKMSGQTEKRILLCVPRFLDAKQQFELLSFQVPRVIRQHEIAIRASQISVLRLADTFEEFAGSIHKNRYSLEWFVREVFTAEQINEFLQVIEYCSLDCLRRSYELVTSDLKLLRELLTRIENVRDVLYHVSLLDSELDLTELHAAEYRALNLTISEPRLVTQFRVYYRQMLLEHVLEQIKQDSVREVANSFALSDAESLYSRIQNADGSREYSMELLLDGNGGTLKLLIEKKDLDRLRAQLAMENLKLFFAFVCMAAVTVWMCRAGLWFLFIYGWFVPLGILGAIWSESTSLKSEIEEYERQRRAWPSKT